MPALADPADLARIGEHRLWALTDADGGLLDVVDGDLDDACHASASMGAVCVPDLQGLRDQRIAPRMAANVRTRYDHVPQIEIEDRPAEALRRLNLQGAANGVDRSVMYSMFPPGFPGFASAWEELRPLLPTTYPPGSKRGQAGAVVGAFATPGKTAVALLGQNSKMSKEAVLPDGRMAHSRGISFAPYHMGYGGDRDGTLCLGSSVACRLTCLAFSGVNELDPYNAERKRKLTEALRFAPYAFMRVLVESLAYWQRETYMHAQSLCPRLNTYSDVPWELVAPWLYKEFRDLGWYDYTKVPGRRPPENYDLTFSYDGENYDESWYELVMAKRRLAVVFFLRPEEGRNITQAMARGVFDPFITMESPDGTEDETVPCVDGDRHDIRFLDPAPSIVALSYKPPRAAAKKRRLAAFRDVERFETFAIPAFRFSGQRICAATAGRYFVDD